MKHLTDTELIDYVIRYDDDPVRVRLAGIMDRMPGSLIDTLVFAGMDSETWLFENTYDAGNYIRHLESEIDYLSKELLEVQEKLRERETLSVAELIEELILENRTLGTRIQTAEVARRKAEDDNSRTQAKMKVWTALSTDLTPK